jgi:hypothetical protein
MRAFRLHSRYELFVANIGVAVDRHIWCQHLNVRLVRCIYTVREEVISNGPRPHDMSFVMLHSQKQTSPSYP